MDAGTVVEDLIGKVHELIKRLFEVYPGVAFITGTVNCQGIGFNNRRTNFAADEGEVSPEVSLSTLRRTFMYLESITF